MARQTTKRITSIGGQALIEGIMMRGPKKTVVASRLSDKSIDVEDMKVTPLKEKCRIFGWPCLRGIAGLIESMTIGYRALGISADKAGVDEEAELSKFDQWCNRVFGDKLMPVIMAVAGVFGVCIAIGLFFFLPVLLFNGIKWLAGSPESLEFWRSTIEGVTRILIFLLYLVIISAIPSVHRMFRYHGAEHKTIFCYENQEELTVENVRKYQRFHPRCGTSFMVLMLIVGIIVGFFIPFQDPILRGFCKVLCLPICVSLGYELIRICGRHDNIVTRIIAAPGMWMQRVTTKEPDDEMIEVAIAAIQEVIPENGEDLTCPCRK